MPNAMAVQVTIYLNEADQWHHRPLHIEILNYLNKETSVKVGTFHKLFYVRKEEIAVFTLMPEELNFLIYNQAFEASLTKRMHEVKDVVVFGCTVALRVSDLIKLEKSSVRVVNDSHYLAVRSQKSATDTLIKLRSYCIYIINISFKVINPYSIKFIA